MYATAFQSPDYFPPQRLKDGPLDNRYVMIGGLQGILGEWGTEQDARLVYGTSISAREALSQSRTAATARLGLELGLPAVKDLVTRAGIKSPLRDYPSSFLGASEVKLDEMCLAYSAFANKGMRPKKISIIHRITDHGGNVIFQVKQDEEVLTEAMDEVAAYQTHSCLVDALRQGTGKKAYDDYGLKDFPAAGKTGTHYEFKDLWFVGYTSAVTCGVWCGFDQQKQIYEGAFSNKVALPMWADVMNASIKTTSRRKFSRPTTCRWWKCAAAADCVHWTPATTRSLTRPPAKSAPSATPTARPCASGPTSMCFATCTATANCAMTLPGSAPPPSRSNSSPRHRRWPTSPLFA